ncbi:unnamed protein product [Sphenostylis stenocarpa]|uniref:Uncharacterized protein n=1 Tax=Sphenostylis stenocarpa TaxID=92480 RepID=A0AA86RL07_9FABA|nr:unnamed protein product [Sphenostylis stenocarpa]
MELDSGEKWSPWFQKVFDMKHMVPMTPLTHLGLYDNHQIPKHEEKNRQDIKKGSPINAKEAYMDSTMSLKETDKEGYKIQHNTDTVTQLILVKEVMRLASGPEPIHLRAF